MAWKNVEVQQLSKILLYKMQKIEDSDRSDAYVNNKRLVRSKANRKAQRR